MFITKSNRNLPQKPTWKIENWSKTEKMIFFPEKVGRFSSIFSSKNENRAELNWIEFIPLHFYYALTATSYSQKYPRGYTSPTLERNPIPLHALLLSLSNLYSSQQHRTHPIISILPSISRSLLSHSHSHQLFNYYHYGSLARPPIIYMSNLLFFNSS